MLPLHVNFDARVFLRKVFTTNLQTTVVALPMYLKNALEQHKCAKNARVLKRLRLLSYKSLCLTLTNSGSFRSLVEAILNERPELLAQLMCDMYRGKLGTHTDWNYLHKIVAAHAYPKDRALAIIDKEVAERNAVSVIYSKL